MNEKKVQSTVSPPVIDQKYTDHNASSRGTLIFFEVFIELFPYHSPVSYTGICV